LPGLALFEISFNLSPCSDGSDAAYKGFSLPFDSLPLGSHVPPLAVKPSTLQISVSLGKRVWIQSIKGTVTVSLFARRSHDAT